MLALVSEESTDTELAQRYKAMSGKPISSGTLDTVFGRMKDLGWVTMRGNDNGGQRSFHLTSTGKMAAELTARRYVVAIADCVKTLGRGISTYFDRMNTPALRRLLEQLQNV